MAVLLKNKTHIKSKTTRVIRLKEILSFDYVKSFLNNKIPEKYTHTLDFKIKHKFPFLCCKSFLQRIIGIKVIQKLEQPKKFEKNTHY